MNGGLIIQLVLHYSTGALNYKLGFINVVCKFVIFCTITFYTGTYEDADLGAVDVIVISINM